MTKKCDILIPASIENIININNAKNIKAKLIVEGANGPVTIAADKILQKKGISVIPDFYANSGGVVVSYFEWVKNLSKIRYGMMQEREEEKRQARKKEMRARKEKARLIREEAYRKKQEEDARKAKEAEDARIEALPPGGGISRWHAAVQRWLSEHGDYNRRS